MNLVEWTIWFVENAVKYLAASYLLFHLDIRKGRLKYLLFLYPAAGYFLGTLLPVLELPFQALLCPLLIFAIFLGGFREKVKVCLFADLFISVVDVFLWFLLRIFGMAGANGASDDGLTRLVVLSVWALAYILLIGKRKKKGLVMQMLFREYYWILLIGTASVVLFLEITKGYLVERITDEEMSRFSLFLMPAVLLFLLLLVCLLVWNLYARLELKRMNAMIKNELYLQQRYYDDMLRREQEKRAARHEWKHHVQALNALCEEENVAAIQSYIGKLEQFMSHGTVVDTGNRLADYFISGAIEQLKAAGISDCRVEGHFPPKIRLDDMDLSVLLANALDNVKEALEKLDGRRSFLIEIRSYHDRLYLSFWNTIGDGAVDVGHTSKENAREHGYGMKNMQQTVEKYGGTMQYRVEERNGERMFVLELEV